MLTHLLRFDDLSAASDSALTESFAALLLKHRLPCTFATIPFICDPADLLSAGRVELRPFSESKAMLIKPLLDAGLAEVALHGYAHLSTSRLREHAEFSESMPADVQRKLIRAGRQHLEQIFGTKVKLFVPPWNRLSSITRVILKEEGMLLSGGDPKSAKAKSNGVAELPCTVSVPETLAALETGNRFGRGSSVVGTMLHDHDIKESGFSTAAFSLDEFDRFAGAWTQVPNVKRQLIGDAIAEVGADLERADCNVQLRESLKHSRIGKRIFKRVGLVYWDRESAKRLTRRIKPLF